MLSGNETLDTDGCSLPENFVAISGDVSLAYALQEMASRSAVLTPDLSALATRYLRQMGPVVPEVTLRACGVCIYARCCLSVVGITLS